MDWNQMDANFKNIRVCQLTDKPVDFTTPDCGFETRRIHYRTIVYETDLSLLASESKALRIQSDFPPFLL
jgi:hypothetical protein